MGDGRAALIDVLSGLLPPEGPVLALDVPELADRLDAARILSAEPGSGEALAAAVIGGTEEELIALGRRLRDQLAPGALLGLLFTVPQSGWRAAAARALSWTAKAARRPRELEEISAALLAAGAGPIRIERAKDAVLAWGRIRPRPQLP